MIIRDLLKNSEQTLKHLASAHLDCEVILSYVLNKNRAYILAHLDEEVSQDNITKFDKLIARRANNEPIAYLVKNKEFYGRNFYVDNRVHIPRAATEDMINIIKDELPENFDGIIADIGTGSGCIAITLALEFANAKIIATDISDNALEVAQQNAHALCASDCIKFVQGDLLDPLTESADIIVANLPYGWRDNWTQDKEVFFQPSASYDGGQSGLELINKLIADLPNHLTENGKCFLEFDPRQTQDIKRIASDNNFNISIKKDTQNFNRIAYLTKRANQP